jgi:hypothetical protein
MKVAYCSLLRRFLQQIESLTLPPQIVQIF